MKYGVLTSASVSSIFFNFANDQWFHNRNSETQTTNVLRVAVTYHTEIFLFLVTVHVLYVSGFVSYNGVPSNQSYIYKDISFLTYILRL